jgi:hypothetical protein
MYVCVNVVVHFVMGLVTMIHHKKFVKVVHKTMLKILVFLNAYFKINLKGESPNLGQ